jgi:hypothetical protein
MRGRSQSCDTYPNGQVPPGQMLLPQAGPEAQESHAGAEDALLCPTEKPDRSFFMSELPHWAQVCFVALRLFWRTSIT